MIHGQAEIGAALAETGESIRAHVAALAPGDFDRNEGPGWSPAEYLQHLLLGLRLQVRLFRLPLRGLARRYGLTERPARTYDEIWALYEAGLAQGLRAEDMPLVMPKLPAERVGLRASLLAEWQQANSQLARALVALEEAQLDRHLLPHPALGALTMREMLFFTIGHNRLHLGDMRRLVAQRRR